jgi:pimeloyl-ACP methyl ester carboxylesterase
MNRVETQDLGVAYEEFGARSARPSVLLLHGFPDDASAWRPVGERLAQAGFHALAPYVRGCGPTRFLRADTPRSGQPATRARDVLEFIDALKLQRVHVVGQDWGAATAQAFALLHGRRVQRLAVLNGHGLLNMAVFQQGKVPGWATFHAGWYQWLFQLPMARQLLQADRAGFARHAWRQWSPGWQFDEAAFVEVAASLDNPDWVDVVLSAYSMDPAMGADPRDADAARRLATSVPAIGQPTLNLQGRRDGVDLLADTELGQESFYRGGFERQVLEGCGHFLHREQPRQVAERLIAFLAAD